MRSIAWCSCLLLLSACSAEDDVTESPPAFQAPDDGLPASCHPFRAPGACALPFPSSAYLNDDPDTPTGKRVALRSEIIPASAVGGAFEPARWNRSDGFSWASPILAYFPERLDATTLPPPSDLDASLAAGSATLIVDMASGERVPHFAELDLSDLEESDRQALILRPALHLKPNHHYAVGVTSALRTVDGGAPSTPRGFASALAGAVSSDPLVQRELSALTPTLDALAAAGAPRDQLHLAWDFHTASLESVTEGVLSMRDQALAKTGDKGMGFNIESVELDVQPEIFKRVRGTFKVPSFLSSDDRSMPDSELVSDAQGVLAIQRDADYPFELIIPKQAEAGGSYPLLVFGHGLLGSADEISGGHVRTFCNDKGYLCIGTDWIGLSEKESVGVGSNGAAPGAVRDLNKFGNVGDRLQQALINFMVLTRTARSILEDSQTLVAGKSLLKDPFEVHYYGISQGAIMGMGLMGYAPDIQNGVLQVGGSAYSLIIQRSVDFNEFFPSLRNGYGDRLDQQLIMALWQPEFDRSEGSGTAWAQGVNSPLPGVPEKHLLMQIAVGDSQVTNLSAEIQARTLGLPLVTPSAKEVWGLAPDGAGKNHAIAFWDLVRDPPPETNETPLSDNDVHGDIRKLPENQAQTDVFLRTGRVENTCSGACSFPGVNP